MRLVETASCMGERIQQRLSGWLLFPRGPFNEQLDDQQQTVTSMKSMSPMSAKKVEAAQLV